MAVESGTATDHVDLYNKLYNFLTSNTDLVNAGQAWERVTTVGQTPPFTASQSYSDKVTGAVMLKGPGLAGSDEIFVSMHLIEDTGSNRQMIHLMGHKGVLSSHNEFDGHVGSSGRKGFVAWAQNMGYWFVANGRRFYGIVKLGTVYEVFYGGFYLPYASPDGNPYPLMIGGTTRDAVTQVGQETSNNTHGAFTDPYRPSYPLAVLTPAGTWVDFHNGDEYDAPDAFATSGYKTFPFAAPAALRNVETGTSVTPPSSASWKELRRDFLDPQKPLLGGGYLLNPITLLGNGTPVEGAYGLLDGVFHVTGYDNVAENTVTVGGTPHLVVHNVFRTANNCYTAYRLE